MSTYPIRLLSSVGEMKQVEELQRIVWDSPSTVIYEHMLMSFARNGCLILGAFDGDKLIGFLLSFFGLESPEADRPAMANLKIASQRLAILPEYRNSGIGYQLKLEQRRFAVKQGVRLITWTFDPLQSRNAHFNIRKLGAVVREYGRDLYGTDPSPLVSLGTSDRLIVEWWVTNNRVEQRLNAKRTGLTLKQYVDGNAVIVNGAKINGDGILEPTGNIVGSHNTILLVEVPSKFDELVQKDAILGAAWRDQIRVILQELLTSNYMITDFVHGEYDGVERSYYVLSYADTSNGQFSMN